MNKNIFVSINCNSFRSIIFSLVLVFCVGTLSAQDVKLSSRLDTTTILLGDQVNLRYDIKLPAGYTYILPAFSDTIGKIELVEKPKIDTASQDGNFINIRETLLITCFDSGLFVIPSQAFYFRAKEDTSQKVLYSDSLVLRVKGIQVDTTKEIKDIKPPLEVPFSWKEFFKEYKWYILAGIAVLAAIGIFLYLRKKIKKPTKEEKPVPSRPADIIAFEKLEELEKKKLWQQGASKQYHSDLSDILRTYIEARYGIMALELTTDETISALRLLNGEEKMLLQQVLHLSDMVKFAKAQPLPQEHELSMRHARDFIFKTSKKEEMKGGMDL